MSTFDEYIVNLKAEAERGSAPNYDVPIDRFIKVADNIAGRVETSDPVPNSKKELYDLSQKFMLMTRYVSLFTRVIWSHPGANGNADVARCRAKAIEFLQAIPHLRTRMHSVWQNGTWTPEPAPAQPQPSRSASPEKPNVISASPHSAQPGSTKYPAAHSVFPTSLYPKLDERSNTPPSPLKTVASYPALTAVPERQGTPPAKRQCSYSDSAGITIPFDLAATFSEIAKANMAKGIETCGVLLGFNQDSSLLVTTVVVPCQSGTRDTCETLPGAEERILSYALSNDLVCLGWIHTHPTQSCFLSSVDMHTTLAYQQMLPSAVAIVVAPTDDDLPVGVWRLTETGMRTIRKCPLRGFHEHDTVEPLTCTVNDVQWDTTMKVVVVDHRKLSHSH